MSFELSPDIDGLSFYLETCGCAKNSVDSENLIALLSQNGLHHVHSADEAAILVVNTCGFIDSAKRESINIFSELRERYPHRKLVVTGCLAQRYLDELNATEAADLFVGNRSIKEVAEAVLRVAGIDSYVANSLFYERKFFFSTLNSAYVKLAEGCNNGCTFCAIPLIRGAVKSRTQESVVAEVKALVASGIKEVNLVAQDLTAFGKDRFLDQNGTTLLERLLKQLNAIDGDFWIRLLYIHPDHFTDSLIDTVAAADKILPYFDIPFQHASSSIVKRMGRRGNSQIYTQLIQRIRQRIPKAVIRSTFMAGFPGEKAKDVAEVNRFLKENQLDWVGFFIYSREENTAAAKMRGRFFHRLAQGRALKAKEGWETIQTQVTVEKLRNYIGWELPILLEEVFKDEPLALGRAWFQAPEVDGCVVVKGEGLKAGEKWLCRIVGANGFDLEAEAIRLWTT